MTTYLTLGTVEEFPKGPPRAFTIGDVEVAVVNGGKSFYAFSNICTHRAERLMDGFVEDDNIVCAYHEAVYDMKTGEPIEGPTIDPLAVYSIRVEGNEVQISWPTEAEVAEVKHEAGYVGD